MVICGGRSTSGGMSSGCGDHDMKVSDGPRYSGEKSRTIVGDVDKGIKLESRHCRCFGEYEIEVEEKENKRRARR
jgi:hypothetical protein